MTWYDDSPGPDYYEPPPDVFRCYLCERVCSEDDWCERCMDLVCRRCRASDAAQHRADDDDEAYERLRETA